jgi:hypothetical protein
VEWGFSEVQLPLYGVLRSSPTDGEHNRASLQAENY